MSTAGKVLVVLSVLMMAVWVVLISAVAQLNMTATENIKNLKADVAKLKVDVAQTQRDAEDRRSQVIAEQVAKERSLFGLRARLSDAERQLSTARESLSRVQFQLANYLKTATSAKEDQTLRIQEKADLEKAKADEEALVKRLQGENSELLDSLLALRAGFQETLKKNTAEVQRALKGNTRPAARPASYVR